MGVGTQLDALMPIDEKLKRQVLELYGARVTDALWPGERYRHDYTLHGGTLEVAALNCGTGTVTSFHCRNH